MSDKVSTKITFENEVYTVKDPNAINKYEDSADSDEVQGQGDVTGILNFSNGMKLFGITGVDYDRDTETINFGEYNPEDNAPVYKFKIMTEDEYSALTDKDPYTFYLLEKSSEEE